MKIGVLLHGSGVYDGTEIHEAVLSLLAIAEAGHEYQCIAPNVNQYHVVNHLDGSEMDQERNVLIESARIARGEVIDLADFVPAEIDALFMPGGFGTAKNLTQWAFDGPGAAILPEIKSLVLNMIENQKPIAALCMSPTTVAKALEGSHYHARLSVGSSVEASPYDIAAISGGMESIGVEAESKTVAEVSVDSDLKIVCAPCYMMEASILEVRANIQQALEALIALS
ncbi:isoprenoid biosynthesis glyoxalase ElbB [Croceimicrobium sp.]|uniref:isoprenoid biosynthesis glyoxalase ElbB n=1 Tax=Croceimicrobium sp. TaxID=2828340 RepID=UPI003BABE3ED